MHFIFIETNERELDYIKEKQQDAYLFLTDLISLFPKNIKEMFEFKVIRFLLPY